MKLLNKAFLFAATIIAVSALFIQDANAIRSGVGSSVTGSSKGGSILGGGKTSIGFGGSTVSSNQNDLNSVIDSGNYSASSNTKNLGSAYEFYINWISKIYDTPYALIIRPSYFTQTETGTGTGGHFDYSLTGYTLFSMFRMYALENSFIHFFLQGGVGYGNLTGNITAASKDLEFNGSAFGAVTGIGVDFCFSPSHCITVEGNLRYLPIDRNMSSAGNCTDGTIPGVSQCGGTAEVERSGNDLRTTMSGVQGVLGYTYNF